MHKLLLVLAESGLETIPREIWGHPAVAKSARRRGKPPSRILLDRSLHHHAMKKLSYSWKRGRPDIVHIVLLEALGSPINKEGLLEIIVHTVNNDIISVSSSTRLPRNYNRFVGLMEQLFEYKVVPPGSEKPLLRILGEKSLERVIGSKHVIVMWEKGECISLEKLSSIIIDEYSMNVAVIVGGFPHGDFDPKILGLADYKYCIYGGRPLDSWIVVSSILTALAMKLGII